MKSTTSTKTKTPNPIKLPKIDQKRAHHPLLEIMNKDLNSKPPQPKRKLIPLNKIQQPQHRIVSKPSSDSSTNSSNTSSNNQKIKLNKPKKLSTTSQKTTI